VLAWTLSARWRSIPFSDSQQPDSVTGNTTVDQIDRTSGLQRWNDLRKIGAVNAEKSVDILQIGPYETISHI